MVARFRYGKHSVMCRIVFFAFIFFVTLHPACLVTDIKIFQDRSNTAALNNI